MKQYIVLTAIVVLFVQSVVAENETPASSAQVVKYQEKELMEVTIQKATQDMARVHVFSEQYQLLLSTEVSAGARKRFDTSQLAAGFYIVSVEVNGQSIHTEIIEVKR